MRGGSDLATKSRSESQATHYSMPQHSRTRQPDMNQETLPPEQEHKLFLIGKDALSPSLSAIIIVISSESQLQPQHDLLLLTFLVCNFRYAALQVPIDRVQYRQLQRHTWNS